MIETLLDLLSVASLSMFKFFFAPFLGAEEGLHFVPTFWACIIGMNLSVFIFSLFGDSIKLFIIKKFYQKKRKVFTPSNRRLVAIWQKYGLFGVALLTPPLLTPPIGTLLASGFGERRRRIMVYMFVSSLIWGLILCYASYGLKEELKAVKEFLSVIIRTAPHSGVHMFLL
jgi:hypothetical protein